MSQWDYKIDEPIPGSFPFPNLTKGPGIKVDLRAVFDYGTTEITLSPVALPPPPSCPPFVNPSLVWKIFGKSLDSCDIDTIDFGKSAVRKTFPCLTFLLWVANIRWLLCVCNCTGEHVIIKVFEIMIEFYSNLSDLFQVFTCPLEVNNFLRFWTTSTCLRKIRLDLNLRLN